ncbi:MULTISPECIES: hypothetical protein [Lactiplantibacillus]|jgi:hypothetical protein|uniref:Uncharacterized protein n=4 Tax=Lactiplantibacillus TaxID=2767842 RepID=F9UTX2_LACPL|nr:MULTISPECIES: hypothetical protein [Lactiplantibacillus]AJO73126.1 membrane protein [Lactiplantibacillus plantarum]ALF15978.1 hypothetical protein AKJ11_13020 [Lactiplantibacillus plantarum]KKX45702.1 membrane protein [Lactiplantibacillus plantarum]MBA3078595.1 hypothetical protein [Lactiplantibacillus plantarum]MBA3081480.1 hypothetical protein [Lactiplantibacillus plantarum]
MSNLKILKNWGDNNLLELSVSAESEFVTIRQMCYVQDTDLKKIGEKIIAYSFDFTEETYVEFGKKKGDFTPAFSLRFLPTDNSGHVEIEIDMEIDDNPDRKHRCKFYIYSELGLIEQFGRSLILLSENKNDDISLNIRN